MDITGKSQGVAVSPPSEGDGQRRSRRGGRDPNALLALTGNPIGPSARDDSTLHASALAGLEEGVLVIDREGGLLLANAAASSILGVELTVPGARARSWNPLAACRSSDHPTLDVGKAVLGSGVPVRDVAVELERNGSTVLLSVNYLPLRGGGGEIDGLVLSFRDTTDTELRFSGLLEAYERLREAHDVARLASWEWQPESGGVLVYQALGGSSLGAGTLLTLEEWLAMIPASEHAWVNGDFAEYLSGERQQSLRTFMHQMSSGPVWLEVRSRALRDTEGRLVCVRGTAQDVSARELAHRELADTRDFFQATLDSLAARVVVLDEHGEIVMTNRSWSEFAAANGAAEGSVTLGVNYLDVCDSAHEETALLTASGLRRIGAGLSTEFSLEYECAGPDIEGWFQLHATRYEGSGPLRIVVTHDDVTDRKVSEQRLLLSARHLRSVTDCMAEGVLTVDQTGCVTYMNRAAQDLLGWSMRQLDQLSMPAATGPLLAEGSEHSIGGSQVFRAWRDGETVRSPDDVFVRADGSELPVSFTASPLSPEDGGTGCVVVFEDITRRKAEELVVERDLDKLEWVARVESALTEDRFVLHAQPILELATGRIVQHELLIRMRHPTGSTAPGLIPPGYFLPVAEEFGQITEIDRWVIDRASEIAATGLPVELNVSGRSISDPRLVDYIKGTIARTGADPGSMVFEITETTLVSNEVSARAFVHRLHKLGCRVALDDFGTGYGGFTYVKQLPIDLLKIDIEFVRDLLFNPASRTVIRSIVKLAQGFGLRTVAEGVEDADTMNSLAGLGVDYAQGYQIGRPKPIENVSATALERTEHGLRIQSA